MGNVRWLHLGAGNIFRVFIAAVAQDLAEAGLGDPSLAVCECYDGQIIPLVLAPNDNETLAVTLYTDGRIETRNITAVREAFNATGCADGKRDLKRLCEVASDPALQIISLTITEKGYAVGAVNTPFSPDATALECLTAALLARFEAGAPPLALVAMDNFAANGDVLHRAVRAIALAWAGRVPEGFVAYIDALAYPWTMIDKITPHPSLQVSRKLAIGYPITTTEKGTVIAPFVNAEAAQYLVMEDRFPNGRPPFEKLGKASGVYLTDRETVRKVDHMKVCACLNPLHTLVGLAGMLLRYPTIAACMADGRLAALARRAAEEALPVVAHPGIIDPREFLEEVLTKRFPNPFIPDTPTRITTDSSQKIPVRFGQTLKARQAAGLPMDELEAVPLLVALWLRYRMGVGDDGAPLALAPDPLAPQEVKALEGLPLGLGAREKPAGAPGADLRPILCNEKLFGIDLCAAGLGERVEALFTELASAPGAVGRVLDKYAG